VFVSLHFVVSFRNFPRNVEAFQLRDDTPSFPPRDLLKPLRLISKDYHQ
jgi:hypothetical protein